MGKLSDGVVQVALDKSSSPEHGQYPRRTNEKDADQDKTHNWLSTPGLKSETEGFIIAAQDQYINTNYHQNKILKDGTGPMCRICGQFQGTVAKTEYIQGDNKAASYLHWTVCKHFNIKVQDEHYDHEPATVTENQRATIFWDMSIQTDKEIKANRPDIVVKDKNERICPSPQKGTPR